MAISKSFELYECDTNGDNEVFIRNVAIVWPVFSEWPPPTLGNMLPEDFAARLDQATDDRSIIVLNAAGSSDPTYITVLQAALPASINAGYSYSSGRTLKLKAGNGSYAIASSPGASNMSWQLYNSDGSTVSQSAALRLPFSISGGIAYQAIQTGITEFVPLTYYNVTVSYYSAEGKLRQSGTGRTLNQAQADWLNAVPTHITPPDPYTPGEEGDIDGPSGPGGGGGDHDTTSDPIDVPSLPTTSAVDTGFITLFNPSLAEIRALANYMWNGLFDINNLRKLFADPMDVILGLSIVPGPVPSGAQEAVSIGNISTGVMMTKAADQFFTVDCGTLKPTEFWGAYLDYSPYTKVDIYLPFIGMRSLSIDDVMEKNVNVVYHVDILSGACVAFIKSGDQVLYTHIGQCASSIPINGNDWTNTINGILSMAAAIAGTVATGGAAAPMLMGQAANITNILKPSVARSGGMGGMGGMLGIQKPYLILTRPRQCVPGNQNIYKGYPAFMTRALGDLSGMTSVEDIHLAVAGATQEELEEIERLLKEGVLL